MQKIYAWDYIERFEKTPVASKLDQKMRDVVISRNPHEKLKKQYRENAA